MAHLQNVLVVFSRPTELCVSVCWLRRGLPRVVGDVREETAKHFSPYTTSSTVGS